MPRPRLKAPSNDGSPLPESEPPQPIPLPALSISGVVVRKKDLVEALRVYVPLIADIQAFEDGENFYLVFEGKREKGKEREKGKGQGGFGEGHGSRAKGQGGFEEGV